MHRQVTYSGNQIAYNEDVEVAYQSALSGFRDYLENYNQGRGFILIGHSQGAAHTARLIDEEIDNNPELRSQLVGAIAPGANINVPVGKLVGGMYENVPACSAPGEIGCLVAYSMFKGYPGDDARFSRLNTGYWIYDLPRPNPAEQEAVCVDPSRLDGSNGVLNPLINKDYLTGVPEDGETEDPWISMPDFYGAACQRQNGAHWLNLSTLNNPGDTRPDLAALLVGSSNNYHVPELNLAEGNLLNVARSQTEAYVVRSEAIAQRPGVVAKLDSTKKKVKSSKTLTKKLGKKLKKAKKQCRKARKSGVKVKPRCKAPKKISRKLSKSKKRTRSLNKQVGELNGQLREIDSIIG